MMTGVRAWYVAGGLVCIAMGVAGFLLPPLLRIEASPSEGAAQVLVDESANAGE